MGKQPKPMTEKEAIRREIYRKKTNIFVMESTPEFYQGYLDRGERLPGTNSLKETRKLCQIMIAQSKKVLAELKSELAVMKAKFKESQYKCQ